MKVGSGVEIPALGYGVRARNFRNITVEVCLSRSEYSGDELVWSLFISLERKILDVHLVNDNMFVQSLFKGASIKSEYSFSFVNHGCIEDKTKWTSSLGLDRAVAAHPVRGTSIEKIC